MKRIQAACILQTLAFSQKPEMGLDKESTEKLNRAEYERYLRDMDRTKTRYRITSEEVLTDGTLIIRVRKQYNPVAAVDEYFV